MLCKGYEKLYEFLLNLNTDIEDTNTEKIRKFARLGIVYVGNPNLISYCPLCVAINPNNSKGYFTKDRSHYSHSDKCLMCQQFRQYIKNIEDEFLNKLTEFCCEKI